jgi:hypothetical protein
MKDLKETVYIEIGNKQIPVGGVKDYIDLTITETAKQLSLRLNTNRTANNWISEDTCREFAEVVHSDIEKSGLIKKDDPPKPFIFKRKTFNDDKVKVFYAMYRGSIRIKHRSRTCNLMENGFITQIENIPKLRDETKIALERKYPTGKEQGLGWLKEKGIAWTSLKVWLEVHWYQHININQISQEMMLARFGKTKEEKFVGVVYLKPKPPNEGGILVGDCDKLNRIIEYEKQLKEKKNLMEEHGNPQVSNQTAKQLTFDFVKLTKETFFKHYKPSQETKVVTETGATITSESILVIVRKLKQCMKENDYDGFCNIIKNNDKRNDFSESDHQYLFMAVISDTGDTVFDLVMEMDDIDD